MVLPLGLWLLLHTAVDLEAKMPWREEQALQRQDVQRVYILNVMEGWECKSRHCCPVHLRGSCFTFITSNPRVIP